MLQNVKGCPILSNSRAYGDGRMAARCGRGNDSIVAGDVLAAAARGSERPPVYINREGQTARDLCGDVSEHEATVKSFRCGA